MRWGSGSKNQAQGKATSEVGGGKAAGGGGRLIEESGEEPIQRVDVENQNIIIENDIAPCEVASYIHRPRSISTSRGFAFSPSPSPPNKGDVEDCINLSSPCWVVSPYMNGALVGNEDDVENQSYDEGGEEDDVESRLHYDPSIIIRRDNYKEDASELFLKLVEYSYEVKKCEGVVYARISKKTEAPEASEAIEASEASEAIEMWTCEKDQVNDFLVLKALDFAASSHHQLFDQGKEPLVYRDRLECAEALVRAMVLRIPEVKEEERSTFYKRVAKAHLAKKAKATVIQTKNDLTPAEQIKEQLRIAEEQVADAKLVDRAKLEFYAESMTAEEKATAVERAWEAYGKGENQMYQGVGVFVAVNGLSTQFLEKAAGVATDPLERMLILLGAFILLFISWPAFVFNLREAYKNMMESKIRTKYPVVTHASITPTAWFFDPRRTFEMTLQVSSREDMICKDDDPALKEPLKSVRKTERNIYSASFFIIIITMALNWHVFLTGPDKSIGSMVTNIIHNTNTTTTILPAPIQPMAAPTMAADTMAPTLAPTLGPTLTPTLAPTLTPRG